MSSTILNGLNKLSLSLGPERAASPTSNDFIKHLDYEELESRFDIHKYYPKYIHNYDYSTPQIKQLIGDKPIYAKANKHIKNWKNPGTKKTFVTEIDLETGHAEVREKDPKKECRNTRHEIRKEHAHERHQLRKQQAQERHQLRQDLKEEKKIQHQERHQLRHDQKEARKQLKEGKPKHIRPPKNQVETLQKQRASPPASEKIAFNDPFGSGQLTLVEEEPSVSLKRHNSIASRLMGKVRLERSPPKTKENKNKLADFAELEQVKTSSSYDATKSNMTSSRSRQASFMKFRSSNRRLSEQIGTYTNKRENGKKREIEKRKKVQADYLIYSDMSRLVTRVDLT